MTMVLIARVRFMCEYSIDKVANKTLLTSHTQHYPRRCEQSLDYII